MQYSASSLGENYDSYLMAEAGIGVFERENEFAIVGQVIESERAQEHFGY
jgi:hypothetical protein